MKTTAPAAPATFRDRGGWWVAGQSLLMAAWLAVPPLTGRFACGALAAAGGGLLLAGAFCGIAGAFALRGSRTAFPVPKERSRLVMDGIYARVRHPLYTSLILLGFGWAAVWHSAAGCWLAVLQAVFLDAKARCEEFHLVRRYADYAAYRARVKRFVPGLY